jgi:hypothetical protein
VTARKALSRWKSEVLSGCRQEATPADGRRHRKSGLATRAGMVRGAPPTGIRADGAAPVLVGGVAASEGGKRSSADAARA